MLRYDSIASLYKMFLNITAKHKWICLNVYMNVFLDDECQWWWWWLATLWMSFLDTRVYMHFFSSSSSFVYVRHAKQLICVLICVSHERVDCVVLSAA